MSKWTATRPTEPGYYWKRKGASDHAPIIVAVNVFGHSEEEGLEECLMMLKQIKSERGHWSC